MNELARANRITSGLRSDFAWQRYPAEKILHPQVDPLGVDPQHRDAIRVGGTTRGRKIAAQRIAVVLVHVGRDLHL